MNLLIDADACPVAKIAVNLCRNYHISCFLLCDTAHKIECDGATTLTFDKGSDSVDFALVNRVTSGDLVITQDYGLASMCLARGARVLHQDGWEYTSWNIDALLLQRHESRKFRASGGRAKGPKKRTDEQDRVFSSSLESILQKQFHG